MSPETIDDKGKQSPPPNPFGDQDRHQPSKWLQSQARETIRRLGFPCDAPDVVVSALTASNAPPGHPDQATWEHSCDRCGHVCPEDEQVVAFMHSETRGCVRFMLAGMLCRACGLAEYGEEPDGIARWMPADQVGAL